MADMNLVDRINKRRGKFSENDPGWVQFIRDHKRFLLDRARVRRLNPETANRLMYRPEEILEEMGSKRGLAWIVMLINDLPSERYFSGVEKLFILPSDGPVEELYDAYTTFRKSFADSEGALVEE